jgi:hypothetical protein
MRLAKIAGMLVCVLVMVAMASAGTRNTMGIRDVYHITFATPVHVGTALLPAGDYTIRHQMEGEDHFMLFRERGKKGSDVKVKCTLVSLQHKADQDQTIFTVNASQERVLQEFVFKGDSAKHVF